MTRLTTEQLDFLFSQRVPLSTLFDASGYRKSEYQRLMKIEGKSFAYGVTPCGIGGHTLRTRAGHCIQCDTSRIAYQLRHDQPGILYMAGSLACRWLKVGVTNDLDRRLALLNHYSYGGGEDWEYLMWAHVPNAGRLESAIHIALSEFNRAATYFREGREVQCYEIFRCSFQSARDEFLTHIPAQAAVRMQDEARALIVYNFDVE